MQISKKIMLIYKINLSLLTLFSLLFYGRGLKGRAGCRQTEVQTDRQSLGPTPIISEHTYISSSCTVEIE